MPTAFRSGPYRFFFYSSDRNEPIHIHIERDDNTAKFWLQPLQLQEAGGFKASEFRHIERLVRRHHDTLIRSWNEFFGN